MGLWYTYWLFIQNVTSVIYKSPETGSEIGYDAGLVIVFPIEILKINSGIPVMSITRGFPVADEYLRL